MLSITVNTLGDYATHVNGFTTLREAIAQATPGDHTINFFVTGIINLSSAGQLLVEKDLTINGPGASLLTIRAYDPTTDAGDGTRVFEISDSNNGATPHVVEINGLTLTGGDLNLTSTSPDGGAIKSFGLLTVRNCTIEGNYAEFGGAIFSQTLGGSPTTPRDILTIEDSVIDDNHAFSGAGVHVVSGSNGSPTADTFTITGSSISGNTTVLNPLFSTGDGGGIYAKLFGAQLSIAGSLLDHNAARGGGGIAFSGSDALLDIVSTTIGDGNTASGGSGGGISARGSSASVNIQSSHITGNHSQLDGGGVSFYGKTLTVQSSEIRGNSSSSGGGGGLSAGLGSNGSITIDESTIATNTVTGFGSGWAGAYLDTYYSFNSAVTITNTTISNNQAQGTETNAGGLFVRAYGHSNVLFDRVKIIDNHADDDVGGLAIVNSLSDVTINNSTISGNKASVNNTGNSGNSAAGVGLVAYNGGTNNNFQLDNIWEQVSCCIR